MRITEQGEAWEMKPRKLTIGEVEEPERVMTEFFDLFPLSRSRALLWEMVRTMVTDGYSRLKPRERSELLFYYEQMEKLFEAVHVMQERNYYRTLQESRS